MKLYLIIYFELTLEFILHDPHQFSLLIHNTEVKEWLRANEAKCPNQKTS